MRGILLIALLASTAHLLGQSPTQTTPTPPTPESAPKRAIPQHHFIDKTNLALFSADFLVRSLDAESTRRFMDAPCRCFVEKDIGSIADSGPRMYSYSLGIAGVAVGVAYVLHRTGHHRLERFVPVADALYDSQYVVENYRLPIH